MKKLFWLAAGITVGLVAAKQIEKNPKAKAAYDDATERLKTLANAFLEGYEEETKPAKSASTKPAK
ncbi:MAG: hypothetical protein RIS26_855 [Actinomycetota bacterium]|jgi:hypothetical protein